jgi:hypothetical protein
LLGIAVALEEPPETVRVRFTNTLRWSGQRWENLLYHRDARVFGEHGRYLKARERNVSRNGSRGT